MTEQAIDTCPWCGHTGELLYVHGHGQCPQCGVNIAPCCNGETAPPAPEPGP